MRTLLLKNTNRFAIGIILSIAIFGFFEDYFFMIALFLALPLGGFQIVAALILIPEIKCMSSNLKYILITYFVFVVFYAVLFYLMEMRIIFYFDTLLVAIPGFLALLLTFVLEAHSKK